MKAVIADVLLSGDFNPVDVNINRVRRPVVGLSGDVYWVDTQVCIVTMVGIMPVDDVDLRVVSSESADTLTPDDYDDPDDLMQGHYFDIAGVLRCPAIDINTPVEERDGKRSDY